MRIPIRAKLTAALAVPMIALVGVAAYEIDDANAAADAADAETQLAVAALGPGSLVSQLQIERNWAGVDQIGMLDQIDLPVSSMEEARANTDAAWETLQDYVAGATPEVRAAFTDGLFAMANLNGIRADIDSSTRERGLGNPDFANEVFDRYSEIIAVILDDTSGIALAVDDATLRTGVEIVDLGTREYEVRANTVRHILLPLLTGTSGVPSQLTVGGLVAVIEDMDQQLLHRSVHPYAGIPEFAVADARTVREDELFAEFVNTGSVDILALAEEISSPADEGFLGLRTQAADRLRAEANAVVADAEEQRRDVVVLGTGVVLIALILTWLVSRSITKPLRSLTRQARAMAEERLPQAVNEVLDTPLGEDVTVPEVEPVRVRTRDEVGDVANMLNVVQERALGLAVEQAALRRNIADSFVNLGRRNQNLVGRQLDFITELERDERDPETLESLFRLDHLATRMRRNAESLLRLAGGEASTGWDGPVTMLDVVRGALGEIEDYTRVELRQIDSAAVAAGVGADLSHAVAELLENALTFSPPTDAVEVRGRVTPEGYVIAIIDNGVGMEVDDLMRANRRLAGEESFTVAPSRYLGHYVAGHLTSRLGIRVQLQPGAAGGITARFDVPAALLVDEALATPIAASTEVAAAAPEVAWTTTVAPAPAWPTEAAPTTGAPMAGPSTLAPLPVRMPVAERSAAAAVEPAPIAPASEPWAAPWDDDNVVAQPAGAEPSSVRQAVPEPVSHPQDAFTPGGRAPVAPDPAPGFGGLAPVTAPSPGDESGDAARTPNGLTRRVPGAQPAATPTPFVNPMRDALCPAEEPAPGGSSPEDVSSFLADFALGVDRGLADAADADAEPGTTNANGTGKETW